MRMSKNAWFQPTTNHQPIKFEAKMTKSGQQEPSPVFFKEPSARRSGKSLKLKLQEFVMLVIIFAGIVLALYLQKP